MIEFFKLRAQQAILNSPLAKKGDQVEDLQQRALRICIFCNKESKYGKGQQTREKLIQCSDLRCDQRIRDVATARHDTNILAIASRGLVAAKVCYHKSCYRNNTRPTGGRVSGTGSDVFTYMKSGGFAVQLGEDNPFGKCPVDQACEETVNKDTKSPGGTKGFNLKPKAVNKYYLVAEYRSIFMRNWKEMLHLSRSSCRHNDLQKSRIARDEADVQSLLTTMEGWVNPCQGNVQDLICLSTGKMASDDVAGDLLQAKHLGERAFQSFSKERLEANSPK